MFISSSSDLSTAPVLDQAQDIIIQALAQVRTRIGELEKRANDEWPKIEQIEDCTKEFGNLYSSISSYEENDRLVYYARSKRTVEEVEKYCKDLADGMLERAKIKHENNVPKIESNKKLIEKLESLMRQIGIPSSYYQDQGYTRGGRKKTEKVEAGYTGDIRRNICTSDFYDSAIQRHKDFLESVRKYAQDRRAKEEAERKEKEAKERETEEYKEFISYTIKYGLPITATKQEVFNAILAKCPFLALAYAMEHDNNYAFRSCNQIRNMLAVFNSDQIAEDALLQGIADLLDDKSPLAHEVPKIFFRHPRFSYEKVVERVDKVLWADYQTFKKKYIDSDQQ